MILEDDVTTVRCWKCVTHWVLSVQAVLDREFRKRLARYLRQLPDGWEMLCLGEGNPPAHISHGMLAHGVNIYQAAWDGVTGTMVGSLFLCFNGVMFDICSLQFHIRTYSGAAKHMW